MKIYKTYAQENGAICCYAENNKLRCLDFKDKYRPYMNDDKLLDDWDEVFFETNNSINKGQKINNIMRCNAMLYITDEPTKKLIENSFSGCIQFLSAKSNDEPSAKYYFLYPIKGIEGLDIGKSECRFFPNSKVYSSVRKYVFRKDIDYSPVFKLKCQGSVYNTIMYATDEFKDFIESNGITGLAFEEIFDFDKE